MPSNWWPHCLVVLISQFFPTLTETYALFLASISQLPQRSFIRHYIQDFVMVKQPSPDRRLVYLHCSSIFSGANAQVRRPKAVSRLLQQYKASIKILTKEFTLQPLLQLRKSCSKSRSLNPYPGRSSVSQSCSSRQRRKRPRGQPLRQKSSGSRPKQHRT